MKKSDQTVLLFQNRIFSKSKADLLNWLSAEVIRTEKPLVLFTPNPEQLVLAQKSPQFQQILDRADVLIPDGIGLIFASRILQFFGRAKPISERIAGIELVTDLLEWAAQRSWKVLLLGGRDYYQAGNGLVHLPANGNSAGKLRLTWLEGYKNVARSTKAEEQKVTAAFKKLQPQLVFVALGAPRQEQWVVKHLALLKKSGTKIVMVVGGSFDMLLGRLKRAPWWLRALGLEWFYRLLQEPRRAGRQLALLEFIGMTLRESFQPKSLKK